MKPGLLKDEIDKTAFYPKGVIVRSLGDATRHLVDVFSEVYIAGVGKVAEPVNQLDLTTFAISW